MYFPNKRQILILSAIIITISLTTLNLKNIKNYSRETRNNQPIDNKDITLSKIERFINKKELTINFEKYRLICFLNIDYLNCPLCLDRLSYFINELTQNKIIKQTVFILINIDTDNNFKRAKLYSIKKYYLKKCKVIDTKKLSGLIKNCVIIKKGQSQLLYYFPLKISDIDYIVNSIKYEKQQK